MRMWAAELYITIRRIPDPIADQPADETYYAEFGSVPYGANGDAIAEELTEITFEVHALGFGGSQREGRCA